MATNGVHIIVSGRVQGVGFRWMTKMVAAKLHITGTVANQMDGSVEIMRWERVTNWLNLKQQ